MDKSEWLQMNTKNLSKKLLKLIDRNIHKVCVPIQNGNSVRLKHLIIRENNYGHLVYDLRDNKQITTTFTKTAAVAIAKNLAEGQDHSIDRIIDLDREIQAKYNKCVQYKSTMINSDNPISIDNAHIRYDITWEDVLTLRDSLDQCVFDK